MNANVVGVGVVLFGLVRERARAAFSMSPLSPLFSDRLICCCLFDFRVSVCFWIFERKDRQRATNPARKRALSKRGMKTKS